MRKTMLSLLLVVFIAMQSVTAFAKDTDHDAMTRGQFFDLVVNQLKLAPETTSEEVSESTVKSAQILENQKIIFGYPDGTIGEDDLLTGEQATYVFGRLLGIKDSDAANFLQNHFDIALSGTSVSAEAVTQAVQRALTSDSEALELVQQSTEKQLAIDSFRSNMEMAVSMQLNESVGSEAPIPDNIPMNSVMEYHKEQGIRTTTVIQMPASPNSEPLEMTMEQYIVPEGMFMKMADPTTGEEQWLNMGELPFSFEQMAKMQQNSLNFNDSLIDKHFFYRYDGEETIEGQTLQKVSFNGQLASFEEIMNMLQEMMPESAPSSGMIGGLGGEFDGSMTFSGAMWIDPETKLPLRSIMDMTLNLGASTEPLESMEMSMDMTFFDYDQVEGIELPEEAKNAVDLTSLFNEVPAEE